MIKLTSNFVLELTYTAYLFINQLLIIFIKFGNHLTKLFRGYFFFLTLCF